MRLPSSPTWLAVTAFLAGIALLIAFEIRSLSRLREARDVEQKVALARFAEFIRIGIDADLQSLCEPTLDVPLSWLERTNRPSLQQQLTDRARTAPVHALFVVSLLDGPEEEVAWSVAPAEGASLAMRAAAAPWIVRAGTRIDSPRLLAASADPAVPMLVRPLVDGEHALRGVAGLVLDTDRLARERLPALIEAQREPTLRAAGRDDPALRIVDGKGRTVLAEHVDEGRGEVIEARRSLYLPSWRIEVQSRGGSIPDESRRLFLSNLGIVGFLALLISTLLVMVVRQSAQTARLARMKSDFVANVSHELRTPLASLRLLGEHLNDGRITAAADVRRYGARIASETRRLADRVNRLLDFSRIESGRARLDRASVRLDELVAGAVERFRASLPPGQAPVIVRPGDAQLDVLVDRAAIEQALLELLDNAVKYSPSDAEVEVLVERATGGAFVRVRDRGPGIPSEEQPRLFERFHRGGSSLVHDVKGFGLGLAIAREIVTAHGGEITVASAPGRGSTFSLFLPSHWPSSSPGHEGNGHDEPRAAGAAEARP